VWIATLSQTGIEGRDHEEKVNGFLQRLREIEPYQPDIVCLPEAFPYVGRPPLSEIAEVPVGRFCRPFAEFAGRNQCYVICPVYTKENGRYYNAAVIIDRKGVAVGEYRKAHPTIGEMERGITPGPLDPPVFHTDFGTVGVQICYDIEWSDGWKKLQQSDAEIVFWPSAFAGGRALNAKAQLHQYCVVSSTRKDTAKICDISGEQIAWTGRWNHWICAPVNLEKAFLHTWPYNRHFTAIQAKYGRRVHIRTFHEEEWTIIESRSREVKVADVLNEFGIKTYEQHIRRADIMQRERRSLL
jgi:predicted amidohydrolase